MALLSSKVNLGGFGYLGSEDVSSATKTLDANDSGKVMNFTYDGTVTVTLPSTAVGLFYTIRVGHENQTLNVSPAALDNITGIDASGTDNKDVIFTSQPVGSFIQLFGNGAGGWHVVAVQGDVTNEA